MVWILIGWAGISIPVALFVGKFLAVGMGTRAEKQIVYDVFDGKAI